MELQNENVTAQDFALWLRRGDKSALVNVFAKVDGKPWGRIVPANEVDKTVEEVQRLNPSSVYLNMHAIHEGVSCIKVSVGDIQSYNGILIDVDNKPPNGERVSATDAEHEHTCEVGRTIATDLAEFAKANDLRLPTPASARTGNGFSLYYRTEVIPKGAKDAFKGFIESIAHRYDCDGVEIDKACCYDAGRITGAPGTVNANKPQRPEEGRTARMRIIKRLPDDAPLTVEECRKFISKWLEANPLPDMFDSVKDEAASPVKVKAKPSTETKPDTSALAELTTYANRYLAKCASEPNGNDRAFRIAGHLLAARRNGQQLSPSEVLRIMLDSEWNQACTPRWEADDSTGSDGSTHQGLRGRVESAAINGRPPSPYEIELKPTASAEVIEVEHASIPDFGIDLSFCPRWAKLVAALHRDNPDIPMACNVVPAAAAVGALIGKRIQTENRGAFYYPNPWTVLLAPTGSAKSNTRNIIKRAFCTDIFLPDNATFPALYNQMGKTISGKEWSELDREQRTQLKTEVRNKAADDIYGSFLLTDEVTGAIGNLMGGNWNQGKNCNLSDVLKLADATDHESITKNSGFAMMYDMCVGFLGLSQDATWEREMGSQVFKDVGLFGRLIPQTQHHEVTGLPPVDCTFTDIIRGEVGTLVDALPSTRTPCTFGVDYDHDPIGEAKESFTNTPVGRYLRDVFPMDWEVLKSKFVVHAIKLSMICAMLSEEVEDFRFGKLPEKFDGLQYFSRCIEIVAKCYAAYLAHRGDGMDTSSEEDKVLTQLRQSGAMFKRDLSNKLQLFGQQFNGVLHGLESMGKIAILEPTHSAYQGLRQRIAPDKPRARSPIVYIPK
ncbi:hypothetical protein ACERK3_04610 [Phycisphaerales bacterium AB-hyl4]|uniref:DUF3987 domain-containing protein n=1 Tax=Natronomicrosphaera hydrolytica TaxID=3242702 RepID=A0ABV4U3T8_9BACT